MTAFYNDNEPFAAEWLRNLIEAGEIPAGDVDARSITEVSAADVVGYGPCHWFAGIGGFPLALRLCGIPDDWPVWTASLPCQPLSSAGQRKGEKDERHLWPEFYRLVSECRPAVIFGEQTGSSDGREWLDGISLDLEEMGYRVGASDLCAASIGAPHIRQRLFWGAVRLADSECAERRTIGRSGENLPDRADHRRQETTGGPAVCRTPDGLADSDDNPGRAEHVDESRRRASGKDDAAERACSRRLPDAEGPGRSAGEHTGGHGAETRGRARRGGTGGHSPGGIRLAGTDDCNRQTRIAGVEGQEECRRNRSAVGGGTGGLVDLQQPGLEGHPGHGTDGHQPGRVGETSLRSIAAASPWTRADVIHCLDGKSRRVEPGVFPLVAGVPRSLGHLQPEIRKLGPAARRNRVGRLKGYGNSIVPQLAALFIRLFLEAVAEQVSTET